MAAAVTGREDGFDVEVEPTPLLGPTDPVRSADPAAFVTQLAHRYRQIAERSAVGWTTYRDGSAVDPEIAADRQQLQDGRRETLRVLLAHLPDAVLRRGLTRASATDTAGALASPETHGLFVIRRGWTLDVYETWVAATLAAALLGPQPDSTPPPAGDRD